MQLICTVPGLFWKSKSWIKLAAKVTWGCSRCDGGGPHGGAHGGAPWAWLSHQVSGGWPLLTPSLDKNGEDWVITAAGLFLGLVRNAGGMVLNGGVKEWWNHLGEVKGQEEDNPSWAAELSYYGRSGIPPPATSQVLLDSEIPWCSEWLGLRFNPPWVTLGSRCWTQGPGEGNGVEKLWGLEQLAIFKV